MSNNHSDNSLTDENLTQVISNAMINGFDDLINTMHNLDANLPNRDGLKWFNLLYLKVTEALRDNPPVEGWENPQFLERLAVVFAGMYLA